jgi:hypothetical protein
MINQEMSVIAVIASPCRLPNILSEERRLIPLKSLTSELEKTPIENQAPKVSYFELLIKEHSGSPVIYQPANGTRPIEECRPWDDLSPFEHGEEARFWKKPYVTDLSFGLVNFYKNGSANSAPLHLVIEHVKGIYVFLQILVSVTLFSTEHLKTKGYRPDIRLYMDVAEWSKQESIDALAKAYNIPIYMRGCAVTLSELPKPRN